MQNSIWTLLLVLCVYYTPFDSLCYESSVKDSIYHKEILCFSGEYPDDIRKPLENPKCVNLFLVENMGWRSYPENDPRRSYPRVKGYPIRTPKKQLDNSTASRLISLILAEEHSSHIVKDCIVFPDAVLEIHSSYGMVIILLHLACARVRIYSEKSVAPREIDNVKWDILEIIKGEFPDDDVIRKRRYRKIQDNDE